MKTNFKVLFLFILFISLISIPIPGSAQNLPIVSVQPSSLVVDAEEAFTLSVTVENVTDLYGFDIVMEFNPDLIQVSGVEMGDFLDQGFYGETIDNDVGTVQFYNTQIGDGQSGTGSGTLLLVHFIALTESGVTSINLLEPETEVVLTDRNGTAIACDLSDGSVEVIGSGEKEDFLVFIPLLVR